jgi:hypothetical protein
MAYSGLLQARVHGPRGHCSTPPHDLDHARAEMDRLYQELDSGKQAAQPSRRKAGAQTSPRTHAAEES